MEEELLVRGAKVKRSEWRSVRRELEAAAANVDECECWNGWFSAQTSNILRSESPVPSLLPCFPPNLPLLFAVLALKAHKSLVDQVAYFTANPATQRRDHFHLCQYVPRLLVSNRPAHELRTFILGYSYGLSVVSSLFALPTPPSLESLAAALDRISKGTQLHTATGCTLVDYLVYSNMGGRPEYLLNAVLGFADQWALAKIPGIEAGDYDYWARLGVEVDGEVAACRTHDGVHWEQRGLLELLGNYVLDSRRQGGRRQGALEEPSDWSEEEKE